MSADAGEILHHAADGCKALWLGGRFEAAHLPLSLLGWLMRHFGAVVRVLVRAVVGFVGQGFSLATQA